MDLCKQKLILLHRVSLPRIRTTIFDYYNITLNNNDLNDGFDALLPHTQCFKVFADNN